MAQWVRSWWIDANLGGLKVTTGVGTTSMSTARLLVDAKVTSTHGSWWLEEAFGH
ncbi:MAG TPA: hypothetical protein VFI30_04795 [Nocardioidaceae bacterium]|nr:hypothetical protein [Nocardioidaceae bacterium]